MEFSRETEATTDLRKILARPLVTGASVSADWSSFSPGKKAALRYTTSDQVRTVAFGGTPGREVWKHVKPADLEGRSSILAVDLFFWDSTLPDVEPSLKTLDDVVATARRLEIPLVLGEIPDLLPGRQRHRHRLNTAIENARKSYTKCRVMPFDRIHREVLRTGTIEYRGRRYALRELVPDGLHLSEIAGDYLADEFEALFRER
jgi:hypothetical protein